MLGKDDLRAALPFHAPPFVRRAWTRGDVDRRASWPSYPSGCEVFNSAARLHPDWCDRGIGTQILRLLLTGCGDQGIRSVALDAARQNRRAIRCYEGVGFRPERTFHRGPVPFIEWVRRSDLSLHPV